MGILYAIINLGCGTLFIAMTLPMAYRKVPMNIWYGARIRQAYLSDEAWYDINEYAARRMIRWSLLLVALGVACLLIPFERFGLVLGLFAPLILTLVALLSAAIVPLMQIIRYADARYPDADAQSVHRPGIGYSPFPEDWRTLIFSILSILGLGLIPAFIIALLVHLTGRSHAAW